MTLKCFSQSQGVLYGSIENHRQRKSSSHQDSNFYEPYCGTNSCYPHHPNIMDYAYASTPKKEFSSLETKRNSYSFKDLLILESTSIASEIGRLFLDTLKCALHAAWTSLVTWKNLRNKERKTKWATHCERSRKNPFNSHLKKNSIPYSLKNCRVGEFDYEIRAFRKTRSKSISTAPH